MMPYTYISKRNFDDSNIKYPNVSNRNSKNVYLIKFENPIVNLYFKLEKLMISDLELNKIIDSEFEYFNQVIPELELNVSVSEGDIIRPLGQGIKAPEDYIYYQIVDDDLILIPDFKTVEVLLFERNKALDAIKILETKDFDALKEQIKSSGGGGGGGGSAMESKKDEWKPDMELESLSKLFKELTDSNNSAAAIINETIQISENTINQAIADANKSKAEAEASEEKAKQAQIEATATIEQSKNLNEDETAKLTELETIITSLNSKLTEMESKIIEDESI